MKAFELAIVTPEGPIFEAPCYQVDIPGSEGRFGVLAGHMNSIAQVKAGLVVVYLEGGVQEKMVVAEGIAEINQEHCIILVEKGTYLKDIDIEAIKNRLELVRHQLTKEGTATLHEAQLAESEYLAAILENFNNAT